MKKIKLWFDGACWPNPGGTGSYGWVVSKQGLFYQEGNGVIGKGKYMSNNVAEYEALFQALKYLKDNSYEKDNIEVYGDSMLVIKQMRGAWKVKGGMYVSAYKRTYCMAKEFKNIKYQWIPRDKNGLADYLSKKHLNSKSDINLEDIELTRKYLNTVSPIQVGS